MGKASYSPLGQWRNKVGGQVYRIDSGEQIISAYQPVVKNPRTAEQILKRTQFTSATRYIAGFWQFIEAMNPNGSRRMLRATIMKRVLATMDAETIRHIAQNGNLVLNKSDLVSITINQPSGSGDTFSITGTIVLADGVNAGDFVNRLMTVNLGITQLDEYGTYVRRSMMTTQVNMGTTLGYTFSVSLDALATGALFEIGAVGTLTSEAWARFSVANALPGANETGSLSEYSERAARQFTGNVGRGVLRT